jgi:hypothetical protein
MRRQLVSFAVAGLAAFASMGAAPTVTDDGVEARPTVAVRRVSVALPAVRDEAAMVLVGTALIGLAAAVRRAS